MTYTKIKITGIIEVKTGLHIGGDDSFAAIGATDSPVVRDPLSGEPIIPGSSLKGKMRSLLAREFGTIPACGVKGFEADCQQILRLFGSTSAAKKDSAEGAQLSRLQFSDCFLANKESLPQLCENKFENTIDRLTCQANPRQIERVIRGAEFAFELIYNVEDPEELQEDFANIRKAINLLENDYLGGGGTRGNGRVLFKGLAATPVTGDLQIKVPSLSQKIGDNE